MLRVLEQEVLLPALSCTKPNTFKPFSLVFAFRIAVVPLVPFNEYVLGSIPLKASVPLTERFT